MSRAQGPTIPVIDSFAQLRQRVDQLWTNNTFAILHPPGSEYHVQSGIVAFTTNLQPVISQFFPVLPDPVDGFRLYPLVVEESTVAPVLRTWSTPGGIATNTVPPADYDATAWVLEKHAPPAFLSPAERVAWIQEWRLSGRQRVRCQLIAEGDVSLYLAAHSNRAASSAANVATNEIGVVSITTVAGGDHAEILLRVPPEVDKVALYRAATLAENPPLWFMQGELPHLTDPIAYFHPLEGLGQVLMFANHVRDSDGDGLPDAMEGLLFHSSTNRADTDGDGLSDYEEAITYQTSATNWDSDGDGLDDALEISSGYDPIQVNDGLTLLDYARMQGIPPMELDMEAFFPAPGGSLSLFGSHTLAGTEPNLGKVKVPLGAQQPAHQESTTYGATQVLGGTDEIFADLRLVAYADEDAASGYCNPFVFSLKYGRIIGLETITAEEVNVTLDVGSGYDAGLGRVTRGGQACFQGSPTATGEMKVRVAVEPALYELVTITPTHTVATVGGPTLDFTALIIKPFPYFDDYRGPIRWDIVPKVPGGAVFSANSNTIYATSGGVVNVGVDPGSVAGEFYIQARIPGRPVVSANFIRRTVELEAYRPQNPSAVNYSFREAFPRTAVPDDKEEFPGVGIRANGQDLNENLIEIQLKRDDLSPLGVNHILRRENSKLKVWEDNARMLPLLGDNNVADITTKAFPLTLWVEYAYSTGDPAPAGCDLNFEASDLAGAVLSSDVAHFYPFKSVLIGLSGEDWPAFGTGPFPPGNNGFYALSKQLYEQGFDVHYFDEDAVAGVPIAGAGQALTKILTSYVYGHVRQCAIYGTSHGGGSTYDLSSAVNGGAPEMVVKFTAYADGLKNLEPALFVTLLASNAAETRRPPGTEYHVNCYETLGSSASSSALVIGLLGFDLIGAPVSGSDLEIHVTTQPWGAGVYHGGIDDNVNVHDIIIESLDQNVDR